MSAQDETSEYLFANNDDFLTTQKACQLICDAFYLARGSEEVSNSLFALFHHVFPDARISDTGIIAETLIRALDARTNSEIHTKITEDTARHVSKRNAETFRESLSTTDRLTQEARIIQLITQMSSTDMKYLKHLGRAGRRSIVNMSVLIDYIIGVGEPPVRQEFSVDGRAMNTVLQLAQNYLETTTFEKWLEDANTQSDSEELIRDDDSTICQLLEIKSMIDLWNETSSLMAPYPKVIQTMLESQTYQSYLLATT